MNAELRERLGMLRPGGTMDGHGGGFGGLGRRGDTNAELRERMGMLNENAGLRERMMMSMMGMGSHGSGGADSSMNTPVTSMRPSLGDADHGGGVRGDAGAGGRPAGHHGSASVLGKRKYSTDLHPLSAGNSMPLSAGNNMRLSAGTSNMGRGGGGGGQMGGGHDMGGGGGGGGQVGGGHDYPFSPKSPTPKKSFLQRERIMDAEMRNHMKEALAGFNKKHGGRRADPRLGSTGQGSGMRLGAGDLDHPPSHPNSNVATPCEMPVEGGVGSGGMSMMDSIKRVKLPSLTSPDEGMGGHDVPRMPGMNIAHAMSAVNRAFNTNALDQDDEPIARRDSEGSSKNSSKAAKKERDKTDSRAAKKLSKKEKKQNQKANKSRQEELMASILATTKMPDKPKRPFSAYNLFFQLEREFIRHEISQGRKPTDDPMIKDAIRRIEEKEKGGGDDKKKGGDKDGNDGAAEAPSAGPMVLVPVTSGDGKVVNPEESAKDPQINPTSNFFDDPSIPTRYSHMKLDRFWYSVGHKAKQEHRKTEGSCGFIELTKMISARWKLIDSTDPHVKEYCQKLAELELEAYKRDMDEYKVKVKKVESEAKSKAIAEVARQDVREAAMAVGADGTGAEATMGADNSIGVPIMGSDGMPVGSNTPKSPGKSKSGGLKRQKSQEGGGKKAKKSKKEKKGSPKAAKKQQAQAQLQPKTPTEPKPHHPIYGMDAPSSMMTNSMMLGPMSSGGMGPMGMGMGMGMGPMSDMARFTDLTRMSGLFAGANTPRGEAFLATLCGDAASAHSRAGVADDGRGNFGGLPPPPFTDGPDGGSSRNDPGSNARARMEARVAAAMGAGRTPGSDSHHANENDRGEHAGREPRREQRRRLP